MVANQRRTEVELPSRLSDWSAEDLIEKAKRVAKKLAEARETVDTQLRRVFDTVRKVELDFEREKKFSRDEVLLIKPRLAYAVARENKLQPLFPWLDKAIDRVVDEKDFQKLTKFVEAVLAYYKFQKEVRR